jgi:hypothetical protein
VLGRVASGDRVPPITIRGDRDRQRVLDPLSVTRTVALGPLLAPEGAPDQLHDAPPRAPARRSRLTPRSMAAGRTEPSVWSVCSRSGSPHRGIGHPDPMAPAAPSPYGQQRSLRQEDESPGSWRVIDGTRLPGRGHAQPRSFHARPSHRRCWPERPLCGRGPVTWWRSPKTSAPVTATAVPDDVTFLEVAVSGRRPIDAAVGDDGFVAYLHVAALTGVGQSMSAARWSFPVDTRGSCHLAGRTAPPRHPPFRPLPNRRHVRRDRSEPSDASTLRAR